MHYAGLSESSRHPTSSVHQEALRRMQAVPEHNIATNSQLQGIQGPQLSRQPISFIMESCCKLGEIPYTLPLLNILCIIYLSSSMLGKELEGADTFALIWIILFSSLHRNSLQRFSMKNIKSILFVCFNATSLFHTEIQQ